MSALLQKHRYFLYLLSETESLKQQKALSDSITPEQFRALTQVVINALHLNIPLKGNRKTKKTQEITHTAHGQKLISHKTLAGFQKTL